MSAVGTGVVVAYDYRALKRASLPEEWVREIEKLDGIKQVK